MQNAETRKLVGVQALRGVAACGVVACHMVGFERKYLPGPPVTPTACLFGMSGVDLYFVLSGFIITTMGLGHFRRGEAWPFLKRRFLRVYPTYWVWCGAVLVLFLLRPGMVNSSHGRPDVLRSLLLLPQENLPLLLVSWTLVYEAFFYLVFAAALRWLNQQALPWALVAWAVLVACGAWALAPPSGDAWLRLLVSPLLLEFMMGCGVALLVGRCGPAVAWFGVALGIAGFIGGTSALLATHAAFPLAWGRVLIFGTASAALVAGVVALERHHAVHVPKPITALGDSSYSLYLSHVPVIGVVGLFWRPMLPASASWLHVVALAVTFAAALLGGVLSFRLIECPLQSALRRGAPRFRAITAAAATFNR